MQGDDFECSDILLKMSKPNIKDDKKQLEKPLLRTKYLKKVHKFMVHSSWLVVAVSFNEAGFQPERLTFPAKLLNAFFFTMNHRTIGYIKTREKLCNMKENTYLG